jgi:serine/threonine protein kinase
LIGVDGVSRLTDFGIARTTDALGLTASDSIRGKVDYMAPERIRAERLDPRCDIWAVGVIAWELLANRRLFRGESAAATLLKVLEAPAPPLSAVRPELSSEIVAAVARALEADIHRRHANAEQFRRQLAQAWRSAGEIAEPSEVGAYVREIVGPKLRQRRARVAEVRTLREEVVLENEDTTVEVAAAGTSRTSWRSFKRWSIVAAALTVVVGIAVAATVQMAQPIDSAASPLGAETPSAQPTSAGSQPPVSSASPASERVLTISSDVEIVSVYVGERAISPPLPTRKLEVHLSPEEARSDPLRLVAVSRDGRRASAELDTSKPFPLGAELPERQWKAASRSAPRPRATRPPPIIR